MTLDDVVYAGDLLQGVDVLGVVPQQLVMGLQQSDELVAPGWLKLTRVDLLHKQPHDNENKCVMVLCVISFIL